MSKEFLPFVGETFARMAEDCESRGYTRGELAESFITAGLVELYDRPDGARNVVHIIANLINMVNISDKPRDVLVRELVDFILSLPKEKK